MKGFPEPRYIRRALNYVFAEKYLLFMTFLMGVIGFLVTFVFPYLIGMLIDKVIAPSGLNGQVPTLVERSLWLTRITVAGLVTAVLFAVAGYGRGHFNFNMGNRIVVRLRQDLFEHLQKLSPFFFAQEQTGSLVWRIMHEVHGINGFIHGGVVLVLIDVLQLAIAFILLVKISLPLTLAVTLIIPFYILPFKFFSSRIRASSEEVRRSMDTMSGKVQETFSGISLIQTTSAEEQESSRFQQDNEHHYQLIVRQSHYGHLMGATSEFFIHLGTVIIIGYGGYIALTTQGMSAGDLSKFLGYVGILYGPLARFAQLNMHYQNSLASVKSVFSLFDMQPEVQEHPQCVHYSPRRGEVRFCEVSFTYPHWGYERQKGRTRQPSSTISVADATIASEEQRWILREVDVKVEPGERIALVGPSGAGKTTLVSLIPRLYDVVQGAVLIDGIDVKEYSLKALRQPIAIVQQETFLFSGTVRDNLLFAHPYASEKEIHQAVKAANADQFIQELKDGYNTLLGERGVVLSGGQKQRLSIARALLRDPRILILDEATSALDTESESLVQEALQRLMEGRTCFIIAHRLSTVRNADRIFALNKGRIIESGNHTELLLKNGLYARLVDRQSLTAEAGSPRKEHYPSPPESPSGDLQGIPL